MRRPFKNASVMVLASTVAPTHNVSFTEAAEKSDMSDEQIPCTKIGQVGSSKLLDFSTTWAPWYQLSAAIALTKISFPISYGKRHPKTYRCWSGEVIAINHQRYGCNS